MFKAVYQFIPSRDSIDGKTIVEVLDLNFGEGGYGFWESPINSNKKIQVDTTGNIRYVFYIERVGLDNLLSEFDAAIKIIFDDIQMDESNYQKCLTIQGDHVVSEYIQQVDDIQEFSNIKFDRQNIEYYEMDDDTIKISFEKCRLY